MSLKMKQITKAILIIPLLVSMVVLAVPNLSYVVKAAPTIGTLNGTPYDDFDDLRDDLDDDYKGKTVTIEMLCDWDAAVDSDFDERLIIPNECTATLNMNGYKFDRDNTRDNDWCSNGELIIMRSNSSLTINGGDTSKTHSAWLYTSTDKDAKPSKTETFSGGLLTGAASTNGAGAIHVESYCTLTLNDVTIAGCRAEQRAGTDGYGGGIWLSGGNTDLRMNNSSIIGCFAYNDGGGIYQSNHNYVRMELKNSHIDRNVAADEGGGINFDGEYCSISGSGESTVSGNKAKGVGGGVYFWNDDNSISGLTIDGNTGSQGGGLYIQETGVSMSGLTVTNNTATDRGGGIYIKKNKNSISNCTITGNSAGVSGNGVYVNSGVGDKFKISGTTVIKDNGGSNLYLSDNSAESNRVLFSLTKGAEVWVRYYDGNHDYIMVTPGKENDTVKSKDCTQYLFSDQDGYYFDFEDAVNMRKIVRRAGTKPVKPAPTEVPAANANDASGGKAGNHSTIAGKVGTVGAGGEEGTDYDLIRGFYLHEKYDSGTEDTTAVFYYSDGLFYGDPYTFNQHLGTASWALTLAGTYLRGSEEADANGNIYYNKHAGARQFLADIGCPDQNIYVNDSMIVKPGTDSIGVSIASKKLKKSNGEETGDILIPVTVRGGGYEAEWASNVTLGFSSLVAGGEAQGFSEAATKVMNEIEYYLDKYELRDELAAGKVKFWVSGFSRAGATANLTSKRLVEKYASGEEGKKNQVFGYPCEAPKGGTDAAEQLSDEKYFCIHNMINKADLVPLVGPEQMGFKRYGVDHYIPGTTQLHIQSQTTTVSRGGAGGDSTTVTTYFDNAPYYTKTADYDRQKALMLPHLNAMDSYYLFDDYFHPMAMKFIGMSIYENGDYAGNREEDFIEDFIRFAQEGLDSSSYNHWSQAVPTRDYWATNPQPVMRDTMSMVFSMSSEDTSGFINRASSIVNKLGYVFGEVSLYDIWKDVIGNWHTLSQEKKNKYTTFFWNEIKKSGAFEFLSEQGLNNLEKNWPTLMDFIFHLTDADYNFYPGKDTNVSKWAKGMDDHMTVLPTFATFSSYILSCHCPELNIAWARTYDSWYEGDLTEYKIVPPSSVAPPEASVMVDDAETQLKTREEGVNQLTGDQKIILENKDIVGEAVYYDLEDKTSGTTTRNVLYRNGGVELSLGNSAKREYTITTYDMSYGEKSNAVSYDFTLYNDRHNVTINYYNNIGDKLTLSNLYQAGQSVTAMTSAPADQYFTEWEVKLLDENGTELGDVTDAILGETKTKLTGRFVMPEVGAELDINESENVTVPVAYSLVLNAKLADKTKALNVDITAPVAGSALATKASVTFTDPAGEPSNYPVSWTYTYQDGDENVTVPTSGNAYNETAYTATIRLPKEAAVFANQLTVTSNNGTVRTTEGKVSKNPDGSVTVVIDFDPTGTEGTVRPDASIKLTINAIDLNTGGSADGVKVDYNVNQNTVVTLNAPEVEDEVFSYWNFNFETTGITPAEGYTVYDPVVKVNIPDGLTVNALTINAYYTAVINTIEVNLDAPVGGEKMDVTPEVFITITNEYEIHPDYLELSWSPEPLADGSDKKADYQTAYTATVKVQPDTNGNIKVRPAGGTDDDWKETKAYFIYSDNLNVTFNGTPAICDTDNNSVSHTFDPTKYKIVSVKPVEPISGVEHMADPVATLPESVLPKTVKLLLNNGSEVEVPVTWSVEKTSGTSDVRDASTWKATGTVKEEDLPDTVENRDKVPLSVETSVSVKAADTAATPLASIPSGEYVGNQSVTLSTSTKDADIYYTTDGSDPADETNPKRKKYEGEVIQINRSEIAPDQDGKRTFVLKALAVQDDLYDSNVGTYEYILTNEAPVPNANDFTYDFNEHIGVNNSSFYTLVAPEGTALDADGNLVVTDAGTYQVTAKIKDGYVWKLTDEEGNVTTTTEDQIITLTVSPASLKDAVVEVVEDPARIVNGKAEPKLKVTLNGNEVPEGSYKAVYSNNTTKGTGSVYVQGAGRNFIDESESVEFEVLPEEFTLTFDLNGGSYNGQTGTITMKAEDGSTVKLLGAPTKAGYEFDYWQGSKYAAGASYKVSGNHTFTAQWKVPDAAKTGDSNTSMIVYGALMLAALAAIVATVIWRRRKAEK